MSFGPAVKRTWLHEEWGRLREGVFWWFVSQFEVIAFLLFIGVLVCFFASLKSRWWPPADAI